MTTTKTNPLPAPALADMPSDGTPLTLSATYSRSMGAQPGLEPAGPALVEDFEESDWEVHRQTGDGWRFIDRFEGRPYDPDIRDSYGPGRYKVLPIGRDGRPVKRLQEIRTIGSPRPSDTADSETPAPGAPPASPGNMPPWMQWQMQQAVDERRDMRLRAEEAEQRREEWERRTREVERHRRDASEEERRERAEREERAATSRQENTMAMIAQVAGIVQTGLTSFGQRAAAPEMNEQILHALLADRGGRSNNAGSIRETLELLMVLDQMAETRGGREREAPEEDGLAKTMASVLPMMAMMKGGGAAAAAAAATLPPPHQAESGVGSSLLMDPAAINAVAAEDPEAVAEAMVAAVRSNPSLERAVVEAFSAQEGGE